MRPLIISIVFFLGVLFIINRYTQVEDIVEVLRHSDWRFFFLAVLLGIGWLFAYAATYYAVFRAMGTRRRLLPFVPLAAAANFVNVIAPSVGLSGTVVLISDARRNKLSPAHATVAGALVVLSDYAGFTFFLIAGLFVLFRRGSLNVGEIAAAAFLFGWLLTLATLLYIGMRSARGLGRALKWMARQGNRITRPFSKREHFSEANAEHFALDAASGLSRLRQEPTNLLLSLFFSTLSKGILLSELMLMFYAFRVPLSPGTLFASFAISYLFLIVSPTPAGIGVVEGALTLALTSMFIPLEQAAVIALGYRAVSFWLPFLFGLLSFQLLHLKKPRTPAETAAS